MQAPRADAEEVRVCRHFVININLPMLHHGHGNLMSRFG